MLLFYILEKLLCENYLNVKKAMLCQDCEITIPSTISKYVTVRYLIKRKFIQKKEKKSYSFQKYVTVLW